MVKLLTSKAMMNIEDLRQEQKRLERALDGILALIAFYEKDQLGSSSQGVRNNDDGCPSVGMNSSDRGSSSSRGSTVIHAVESLISTLPDSFTTSDVIKQLKCTRGDGIKPATVTAALLALVKRNQIVLECRGKGRDPHKFKKITIISTGIHAE